MVEGDGGCSDTINVTRDDHGDDCHFTHHHFSEDATYLATCTDTGIIAVQKMGPTELVFVTKFKNKKMVCVRLSEEGETMTAADSEGNLYFFK